MPSYRRIRQAVARSRVEDVRLGLRLTARQTEEKSTDKGADKPADGTDRPANSEATEQDKSGPSADKPAAGGTAAGGDAAGGDGTALAPDTTASGDTEDELIDGGSAGAQAKRADGDTPGTQDKLPPNGVSGPESGLGGAAGLDDTSGAEATLAGGGTAAVGEGDAARVAGGLGGGAAGPDGGTTGVEGGLADAGAARLDDGGTGDTRAVGDTAELDKADATTLGAPADTAELDKADATTLGAVGDTAELDKADATTLGAVGDTAELDKADATTLGAPADTAELDKADQDQTVVLPGPGAAGASPGRVARLVSQVAVLGPAVKGLQRLRAGAVRFSRLWQPGPGIREAADPGGRAFAMVTVLPALLLIAWLVPGLVLLLANRFLPAPMVLISVPIAVALTMLVAREIPGRWPAPDSRPQSTRARGRSWSAWWGLGGTVVVAGVFAAWQIVVNSPQLIVSRDPGAYAQIAYWIADHGVLPIPASLAAFGGAHSGLAFSSFGFASHGTSVVPRLTVGLPIVLAAGMWAHGITGASVISPLLGALAVLAVGGLTGRLAGPQWAPAGAFLLALTVPEIYTSRSAFSETLAQALLFGGLCLIVDSFSSRRPLTLAALGGLALGFTVLAGTDLLLVLVAVIPVAGALLASRRPQAIPLTAGVLAGVVCGVAAAIGLDFPALGSTTPSLGIIGVLAAALAGLTAIGVTVGLVGPVRRRARKLLDRRPLRWLPDAGAAVVALAALGLAIRPYLEKVRGPANPYIAALQRLESLPVGPGRLYAENSLYWVIWYLGVPALLLGMIGLAAATRMCLRALITWRDPGGTARAWALPVAIIGWSLFAVLWQPDTVPDQPWASRQLVPVILPGLVVLAVWVAAWLIGRAHARGAGVTAVALATACFVVALAVPAAAITFGIELSGPASPATRTALSGLAFRRTGGGELGAVERLCGAIPSHSSVLLLDEPAARAFAEVIRGTCDDPTGIVAGDSASQVDLIVSGIERAGRHPALLATRESELAPYGASPSEIVNVATQQDAHLLTRPPTATWPVHYELWMSTMGGGVNGS
jgi:hypothetical protein